MIETGRLCMKIAGRDAGRHCVVVDVIDDNYVTIDGSTRRKKCNIKHLEPLDKVLKIKQGAGHSEIVKEFGNLGIKVFDTKPKTTVPRPRRQRKVKEKPEKEGIKSKEDKIKKEIRPEPKEEDKPAGQKEEKKPDEAS